MKKLLIALGVAGCFAALSLWQKAMARGGALSTLDIAGAAGVFVVWVVIMGVVLVIVGWTRRR